MQNKSSDKLKEIELHVKEANEIIKKDSLIRKTSML